MLFFWLKTSSPSSLLSHFLKALFQERGHTHGLFLEQCVLRCLLKQGPWVGILRQSRKVETLVASPAPFLGDLRDSMLCSLVLKALFSLYLSKMTWKFFFPSSSPPPSHSSKKNANFEKAVLNYWPLWQTTRIQGKARGKGKRKPKPRANDFPQQEFLLSWGGVLFRLQFFGAGIKLCLPRACVKTNIFLSERKGKGKGKPRLPRGEVSLELVILKVHLRDTWPGSYTIFTLSNCIVLLPSLMPQFKIVPHFLPCLTFLQSPSLLSYTVIHLL